MESKPCIQSTDPSVVRTLQAVLSGMGLLWHEEQFNAYSLKLDWKLDGDDNSGIFVGFPDPGNDPWVAVTQGQEIQIDATDTPDRTTGAVYFYGDSTDLRLELSARDEVGVTEMTATLDGAPVRSGDVIALYRLPLGSHDLVVSAVDAAGNGTSRTVHFVTTTSDRDVQSLIDRFRVADRLSVGAKNALTEQLEKAEYRKFAELAGNPGLVKDAEVRGVLVRDDNELAEGT